MRRKNLMTALLCAAVVAASTVMAPGAVMAEETEAVTEAADTEAATEADTEADTEVSTEASSEEALEITERPDYKALDYVELGEYTGSCL